MPIAPVVAQERFEHDVDHFTPISPEAPETFSSIRGSHDFVRASHGSHETFMQPCDRRERLYW